jgi:hypothetical protein
MVDILERILFEQTVNQPMIQDRAFYKGGPFWNIVRESAAKVIEDDDLVTISK